MEIVIDVRLLDILACPRCGGALEQAPDETIEALDAEGSLRCVECGSVYPVRSGIPRFSQEKYAGSFGFQWNVFRREQIDSLNGTDLSERRFFTETNWSPSALRGRLVLDAGCGAGRFLDVASKIGAEVVGVDLTQAVDAAAANMAGRDNVHIVQADLYHLPFKPEVFDGCYCIGVLQHTPNAEQAALSMIQCLKRGGELAVTAYERKPWTPFSGKYLLRPATKRLSKPRLLAIVKLAMPVAFAATEILFRIPLLKRLFRFLLPIANYTEERRLNWRQRYRWAILDTFDALSPAYDQPLRQADLEQWLRDAGMVDVRRLANPGLNLVGRRNAGTRLPSDS